MLSFNNPYSSLVRGHIADYFDSGAMGTYGGLASRGVTARYFHRTLEEYMDAFLGAGFTLAKLADVSWGEGRFPAAIEDADVHRAKLKVPRAVTATCPRWGAFLVTADAGPAERYGPALQSRGDAASEAAALLPRFA